MQTDVMTSQAAVVELLIGKGRIEPQMAFAIADVIDLAVTQSQFVTVPILDARFADLRADLRIAVAELDKKVELSRSELEKKVEVTRSELEKKIEGSKADVVRWIFLVVLGNVALTSGATAVLNALQH